MPATADTAFGGGARAAVSAERRPLDSEVRSPCDSAAARWAGIPGATLERGDTLIDPAELLPDVVGDSVVAWSSAQRLPGCVVIGWHPAGLDDEGEAKLFWPANGWATLWRLGADGPDGQLLTYQRRRVRCQVSDQWDGGDDSDTTYVPDPFFREVTLCWRHYRELVPTDTAPAHPN